MSSIVIARSEADEAIHLSASSDMDCFASLAMTMWLRLAQRHRLSSVGYNSARSASAADAFHLPIELPVLGVDHGVAVFVPCRRGCVRSRHSRAVRPN